MSEETEEEAHIVLEMAPIELMPHAVHLFLEQVAHNLWNNGWFYLNGPHVLQGGPQLDEDSYTEDEWENNDERWLALKPFRELQLDHLSFPEYSPDYPHVPWTMGFTGRPGGPDFYINKSNNTIGHGPGGQFHYELEEFADPCFATIVEGRDVMKSIFNRKIYGKDSGYEYFLQEPVYIVHAEILTWKKNTTAPEKSEPTSKEWAEADKIQFSAFERTAAAAYNESLFSSADYSVLTDSIETNNVTSDNGAKPNERPNNEVDVTATSDATNRTPVLAMNISDDAHATTLSSIREQVSKVDFSQFNLTAGRGNVFNAVSKDDSPQVDEVKLNDKPSTVKSSEAYEARNGADIPDIAMNMMQRRKLKSKPKFAYQVEP
jgi:hypothetical protein